MPRIPLPEHLRDSAFLVGEGAAAGLTEKRLRGADLRRPHRGVRVVGDAGAGGRPGAGARDAADSYAPLLRPGDRFSHTTAAEIWGAPLPRRLEGILHVTSEDGSARPRSRGVVGHESVPSRSIRFGLPVSPPATLIRELGVILDLDDLVAVTDHLVLDPRVIAPSDPRPWIGLGELRDTLSSDRGPGARRARTAAGLARDGVESPRETALRLMLARAGLPEPICGYELRHPRRGRIGWFDLAWPQYRTIAEYDGDQHRTDTRQYDRDIRRFDMASDVGVHVVRVRAAGLGERRTETVERVRGALIRGGWRP